MEKKKGIWSKQENFEHIVFEKIKYDDCTFFACTFNAVTWKNCHFYQTTFNGDSVLKNCMFVDCKFSGQHTCLGPSTYQNCIFENVIINSIQFWGAKFLDCKISGQAHNVVFYGDEAPDGWETTFQNVDIRELTLDLVDFRTNFDFTSTLK